MRGGGGGGGFQPWGGAQLVCNIRTLFGAQGCPYLDCSLCHASILSLVCSMYSRGEWAHVKAVVQLVCSMYSRGKWAHVKAVLLLVCSMHSRGKWAHVKAVLLLVCSMHSRGKWAHVKAVLLLVCSMHSRGKWAHVKAVCTFTNHRTFTQSYSVSCLMFSQHYAHANPVRVQPMKDQNYEELFLPPHCSLKRILNRIFPSGSRSYCSNEYVRECVCVE